MARKKNDTPIPQPSSVRRSKDWNKEILPIDVCKSDKIKQDVVLLKGLERLANEAGMTGVKTTLITTVVPFVVSGSLSDVPLIQAIVDVTFSDGTIWSGAGDSNPNSTSSEFFAYPTAVAESRALSRALKRALGITMVASEEVGFAPDEIAKTESKIAEQVVKSIEAHISKLGISPLLVFQNILSSERLALVPEKIASVNDLTIAEGAVALNFLKGYKKS